MPNGYVYPGRVVKIDPEGPLVEVPLVGGNAPFGPLPSGVPDLEVGERVIVGSMGSSANLLQVLCRAVGRAPVLGELPDIAAALDALDVRADSLEASRAADEATLASHGTRLNGVESANGAQDTRLTAVEGRASSLETRATSLESRATAVEGVNVTQSTRLDAVEAKNTAQDGRLTATETVANAAAPNITVAHLTGDEILAGIKTFSAEPVIPAATKTTSPVRSDDARLVRQTPVVVLTQASVQSIANTTWTALSFNQTEFDPFGIKNPVNSSQLIIPAGWAGYWEICGSAGYATNSTGGRLAAIAKNAVRVPGSAGGGQAAANLQSVAVTPSRLVLCDVGDILAIHTYQSCGAALSTVTGELGCVVSARWVRPA